MSDSSESGSPQRSESDADDQVLPPKRRCGHRHISTQETGGIRNDLPFLPITATLPQLLHIRPTPSSSHLAPISTQLSAVSRLCSGTWSILITMLSQHTHAEGQGLQMQGHQGRQQLSSLSQQSMDQYGRQTMGLQGQQIMGHQGRHPMPRQSH